MEYISESRTAQRTNREINIWSVAVMVVGSFLIGRVSFLDQMFPAGIALIAIMVSRSTLNFYLLPAVLIGMATFSGGGLNAAGSMGAAIICGFVFMVASRVKFELWHKSIISGATAMISNSVYSMTVGTISGSSVGVIVLGGTMTAMFCVVFGHFFNLVDKKTGQASLSINLAVASVVVMLVASGSEFIWIILPAAMIVTLFSGYLLGTLEGGMVGFISGTLTLLNGGSISAMTILVFGGIVAGFVKGRNKNAAAIIYAIATMGIGFLTAPINMGIPVYGPLLAAGLLILLPHPIVERADLALNGFLQTDMYKDKKNGNKVVSRLQETKVIFEELATMFTTAENERAVIAYQFKGIAQAMDKTINSIWHANEADKTKYEIESAWSGYARDKEVSGDNYLWEDLEDGRFAIVLSDGMGKGEKAAAESGLVVNTMIKLLKAGIEVEVVLKILNSILLLKTKDEIFSTVDLGIVDKHTGKVKFYKIGAATTFIKRRNSIETVKVSAMPLGIVDGLKVDYVTTTLQPGDQIIMISDGVTDSKREDLNMNWLIETAGGIKSKDPQTMCDLIMNRAVENYGLKEKDDMTVLAIRLN